MTHRSTAIEVLAEWDAANRAERYPDPQRILLAMRLAKDLDGCRALLEGRPVDPDWLHPDEVTAAFTASLVQLVRPIDLLHGRAA